MLSQLLKPRIFIKHTSHIRLSSNLGSAGNLNLPKEISNSASVPLPRSVIALSGKDSNKFLNGLITIRPPELKGTESVRSGHGVGAYAAMLNAKGRVLTDIFVYPSHDNEAMQQATGSDGKPSYVLEIDSSVTEKILDLLDSHVLMMDVQIKLLESHKVWSIWDDEKEINTIDFVRNQNLWTYDSRAPGFGIRVVRPASLPPNEPPQRPIEEYMLRRYLFGIPEGSKELIPGKALPLDSCIDYMGGINFNKGCYLGQELTIRTYHQGSVRKRVMPVVFTKSMDEEVSDDIYKPVDFGIEAGANIIDNKPVSHMETLQPIFANSPFGNNTSCAARQRPSGSVIAALGNVGLAKLRTDVWGHDFRVGDLHVRPMTPFWWPK